MDKLKFILRFASAAASGLLPPPIGQIAQLASHGVDEIFAQIDAERQRHGLTWQQLEEQLGAEMKDEAVAWDKFVKRVEAGE